MRGPYLPRPLGTPREQPAPLQRSRLLDRNGEDARGRALRQRVPRRCDRHLRRPTRFDRGPFVAIGTPGEVADEIERWVEGTDLDGFNLRQFLTPGTAEDFIELVIPELQRRGLYRTSYEESTLRERLFGAGNTRLFDQHPGARYRNGAHLGPEADTLDSGAVEAGSFSYA
ncbi:hypothetical protein ACX80J_14315 [Arthrobacter sp. MDB2-24]